MTTDPTWDSLDNYTSDLLDLVADEHSPVPAVRDEWDLFIDALEDSADGDGVINQNVVRPKIRGRIDPRRASAFWHKAAAAGLIVRIEGWCPSDDKQGRNSGKPTRLYRWTGQRRSTA